MPDLSFPKRIYYGYLGYLYWFAHMTASKQFLGVHLSTFIKLAAILLVFAAWLYGRGDAPHILSLLLLVWLFTFYWLSERRGYIRFVRGGPPALREAAGEKIVPYRRIPCIASGVFSLQQWEKSVLLRPTDYWQSPRGDHALMVEHEPKRYLYQFFSVAKLIDLQQGWLLYGAHPRPTLLISFVSIWGPEFSEVQYSIFGAERKPVEPGTRSIYISFVDQKTEQIICRNILGDVERCRSRQIDKS